MTKKHYVMIAEALKESAPTVPSGDTGYFDQRAIFGRCVVNVAEALAADNPRFNREKFLQACGLWD